MGEPELMSALMSEPTPRLGAEPPGWHGKLPTLGDFASRRLPADFIEAWDGWLAEGLAGLQQAGGSAWLQAYLDSPTWRFLLMPEALPGTVGRQVWVGILMPSVDRVGRYFPLTIAQPFERLPGSAEQCRELSEWLDRLEQLAVDALYDDWNIERLEQELLKLVAPALAAQARAADEGLVGLLTSRAMASFASHDKGATLWLGSPKDGDSPMLNCKGLPKSSDFSALLGGTGRASSPASTPG